MILQLQHINVNADEGKLLMAAIAKLTTEHTDKTPDDIIEQLNELASFMFPSEY